MNFLSYLPHSSTIRGISAYRNISSSALVPKTSNLGFPAGTATVPIRKFADAKAETRIAEKKEDAANRMAIQNRRDRRNRKGRRRWIDFEDVFSSNPLEIAKSLLEDESLANITRSTEFDWNPRVDVVSTGDGFHIIAELPGVPKENIRLEVDNDTLTIKGEKKAEHEDTDKEGEYYRREIFYGTFMRQFQLPPGTDPKSIKSSFKDGILKVDIPKHVDQRTHKISVQ